MGGGHLTYAAADGEVNDVTISFSGQTFTVSDTGATIDPQFGCVSITLHQVTCTDPFEPSFHFDLFLRDEDDQAAVLATPAGNELANKLLGEEGNDVLTGGTGRDELTGGIGNDTLSGGSGDDHLFGDPGADALSGGPGRDLARYLWHQSGVTVSINGMADDGNVEDGPPGARDNVAADVEDLQGGVADDTLTGSAGANRLFGYAGSDVLDGAGGDDVLHGDAAVGGEGFPGPIGGDTMIGGAGIDRIEYQDHPLVTVDLDGVADDGSVGENDNAGSDVENLVGTSDDDVLTGSAAANVLDGGYGNDQLNGLAGDDVLDGGPGHILFPNPMDADVINGGTGFDVADYGSHAAAVSVDLDDDVADDGEPGEEDTVGADLEGLFGGEGDDELFGNDEHNVLHGGAGDDLLDGGLGADELTGGPGTADLADYSERTSPVTVVLDAAALDGEAGEGDLVGADTEDVLGGSSADTLTGNDAANFLAGGPGADRLEGGAGQDLYAAGPDDDRVESRDGTPDLVSCGTGSDSVVADGADATDPDCELVSKPPPVVATGEASGIGQTSVTLTGTVNPNGQGTGAYLEVGPTSSYGSRSPTFDAGDGSEELLLAVEVSNLVAGTTYHYRFVASNAAGTTAGLDRTFVTLPGASPPPPPPPVLPAPSRPRLVRCVVPNVRGKKVPAARTALKKRRCTAGKITRRYSAKVKKGRIVSQKPRPGTRLRDRGRVNLVVSRGRKP